MNTFNEKLEALIVNKAWKELSAEEKKYVFQFMEEDSYTSYHNTMRVSQELFKNDRPAFTPSLSHQNALKAKLQENRQEKQSSLGAIINYRMPFYQTALAVAASLLLFWWIYPNEAIEISPQSTPEQVLVYQTDTVYIEKPVEVIVEKTVDRIVEKVVYKTKTISAPPANITEASTPNIPKDQSPITISNTNSSTPNNSMIGNLFLDDNDDLYSFTANHSFLQQQNSGRSLQEDSLLKQFFVPVY